MSEQRLKFISQLPPLERIAEWEALADLEALERPLTAAELKRKAQLAASLPELSAEQECYEVLQNAAQDASRLAPADDPLIRAALLAVELDRLPLGGSAERTGTEQHIADAKPARARARIWLAAAALVFAGSSILLGGRALWQRHTFESELALETSKQGETSSPVLDTAAKLQPRLLLATGDVRIDSSPAVSGTRLAAGAIVHTGSGQACFGMDREVVVCVGSDSELVLSALGAHQRVELRRGRAAARLSTQPQGSDFGVLTHAGEAIAVGTAFAVEVPLEGSAHGGTRLRVLHGTVRAVTTERQLLVAQEQQLDFTTHALSALDSDAAERDRALLSATQLWARGAENRLVLSTDPPKATVMLDNVLLGQTPLSVDVQPGRHEIDVRAAGFGGVVRRLSFAGAPINEHIVLTPEPQLAAKAANAEAAPTSETTPNASTLARTATGLLEQARTARQTSRFSEAASSYRELLQRHPGSAEAGAALLSLAELELTQLGNPSQALGLYSKYLQRGGNLMQEAQYGHLRALRALGRGAEEQREIAAFLRKYPDSAYAAALKRRLPAP